MFKLLPIEVFNGGFSGSLFFLVVLILRLLIIKPKLKISFDNQSEDLQRDVAWFNSSGVMVTRNSWLRMRIKNLGMVKLNNPRVFCLEVVPVVDGKKIMQSITPFELKWAESASSGEIGIILPGCYDYRFDLLYLNWQPAQLDQFYFARKDSVSGRGFLTGMQHQVRLAIVNDNLLVPDHIVDLVVDVNVTDVTKVPSESGVTFEARVLHQGSRVTVRIKELISSLKALCL